MEKHYSIDPGKGEKMDGCPYSTFEDGHDVMDYIVPPKGYIFTGFRFEPLNNNQIYDGKLVAQYQKASIQDRLTSNLWKILIPVFIVAVVAVVVLLAVSIFRHPKPSNTNSPNTPDETIVSSVDSTKTAVALPTMDTVRQTVTFTRIENNTVPNSKPDVVQEEKPQQIETPQPTVNDPNVQFKKEFWTLIHQRTIMMDPYHELYVNYKDKVSGEEYEYLRLVILKDYVSFKEWYTSLKQIPGNQLQSLKTIDDLKKRINEQ